MAEVPWAGVPWRRCSHVDDGAQPEGESRTDGDTDAKDDTSQARWAVILDMMTEALKYVVVEYVHDPNIFARREAQHQRLYIWNLAFTFAMFFSTKMLPEAVRYTVASLTEAVTSPTNYPATAPYST